LSSKKPLHRGRTKKFNTFILEPGQTLSEFVKLKKQWDSKLKASGFSDIEFVTRDGQASPFFNGYSSQTLANQYDWSKEEYYRRAGLFLHHANWKELYPSIERHINKYIWTLWCDGKSFSELSQILEARRKRLEKKRFNANKLYKTKKKRKVRLQKARHLPDSTSVFWIHTRFKQIEAEFFKWIKENAEILD
jgi:hypothetical protein